MKMSDPHNMMTHRERAKLAGAMGVHASIPPDPKGASLQ